jgi:hypothetical protein
MVEQLAVLWATVSSTAEFVLGRLPTKALQVKVVDELVARFQKQEERHLHLEKSIMRVCDLILGPPFNGV